MKRLFLSVVLFSSVRGITLADDTKAKEGQANRPAASVTVEKLKGNPNDKISLNSFLNEQFSTINAIVTTDIDQAEKKLDELQKVLKELTPDDEDAKKLVDRGMNTVRSYRDHLELLRIPLADFEQKLDANPDDVTALNKYVRKISQEISPLARSEPEKAEALLATAKDKLTKLKESTKNQAVTKQINAYGQILTSLERSIESGKKILALIGKDAAPLEVEAWVNGSPLKDEDLKGKVVLLDFWAVWCGPCIATFPHLREWHEKYSDKGLVIIGLTKYYNYAWDDAAGRAVRSQEKVPTEEEQKMLEKFADDHNLHHRFGVQSMESKVTDYYAVSGIPHVVIIDQAGKVRLIRVGSGDKNAQDIASLLEKLLNAPTAAAGS